MSIFVIDIPDDPQQRTKLDGLLNGLEEVYGLAIRTAIVVFTDESDSEVEPVLARISSYAGVVGLPPGPAAEPATEPVAKRRGGRRKKSQPAEVGDLPASEPAPLSDPVPAAAPKKANGNHVKVCETCGEKPARKGSRFCSKACYMKKYWDTYQKPVRT